MPAMTCAVAWPTWDRGCAPTPSQHASPPSSDGLITGRMLRDFQRQQGAGLAQPLLAEVMRQLTTMQIPAAWAAELAPGEAGPARAGRAADGHDDGA